MNTTIFDILAENEQLKVNILRSSDLLKVAATNLNELMEQVDVLTKYNADLDAENNQLQERNAELETENDELSEIIESLEDEDGCTCDEDENEHYNDTNANEDFLKEMALILANDESISPSEIPQLLTDIVTAIKLNTSR